MAEGGDQLSENLAKLTLSEGFLENACERMTQRFGEAWRDLSKVISYKWGTVNKKPKSGDEAERFVVNQLASRELSEMLQEPVYIISGREYCQLKTEPERNASKWIIGENDIILITRKLGIVNIEVKDRKIAQRDLPRMIPSFNQQSSKNIGVLEDTLLRLVQSLPKGTLAKYGYSCADAAVKNLNIRKVPGLVALPNIKRSDYEKDVLQLVPDNVLFEENLCSSAALYQVIQEKIGKARENHGLTWPKEIQDKIIAGLFGMTYLETALFPIKSIQEVTEALFVLTEEQANVVADQNVPRRWITGPAGTGKTWMLLLSLRKTYHSFMAQKRGKRKILTITFNSALRDYIEDTAKKLVAGVELSSKVECKIDVFTVESLKKHLKRKMIGKTNSLLNLNSTSLDEDMDFSEVFSTYHDSVTSETFHSFENFGYDAIFVDEAQDIPSTDEDWIRKLWKDGRRNDLRKLWIFGDEGQNMTGFLGNNQSLLSQKLATDPDAIQNLNKQCRTTLDIYERYHKIRYEHDAAYNGNDNGAGTDKEEYENDDGSSDGGESSDNEIDRSSVRVHCNKCNVSTFNIRGQKVEEKNVGLNYVPTEIVSKLEVLVRTELIAVEDIAVLCASHLEVEDLEKELPALLTVKPGGLFKKGNLQIVKAEDFATKCTKLHKSRKRKLAGEAPSQKKYLMVDTVRRFKGLEAQVVILVNNLRPSEKDGEDILYVGMSRAISKLVVFNVF